MKRKTISKKDRQKVYDKFAGHCAYCGCEITLKEMRVDHFVPFRKLTHGQESEEIVENINNYIPACFACNYYKRARNVNSMRKDIEKIYDQLNKSFDYRLAKKYGLIQETPHKVTYLFEENEIEKGDIEYETN